MPTRLTYEDFIEGQIIPLGEKTVSREEIIAFAREFDPAPFHLSDEAAAKTPLGRLSASGFHTCAIAMRMMCDAFILKSSSQGSFGVDECRWLKPVHPGDTLAGSTSITNKRLSASRPGLGFVDCVHELRNQHGELVLSMKNAGMFKTRAALAEENNIGVQA